MLGERGPTHFCRDEPKFSFISRQATIKGLVCRQSEDAQREPPTHTWARGGGTGGEGNAHRLTPQKTVPLPVAKFDPPN